MRFSFQKIIVALGFISLGFGIWQMLQTVTMIIPAWLFVIFYLPVTLCVSLILGVLVKGLLKSKWRTLTFTSIFVTIICSVYYLSEYKPTYRIIVPDTYAGEVKLLVSNQKQNNFILNKYGIGYINKKTFENGFYPQIIRKGVNITKQVKEYYKSSFSGTTYENCYPIKYLSFFIDFNRDGVDFDNLIETKAIDTTILYRK